MAEHALGDPDVRRLMTIPGIDVVTASTLTAVIGDVGRFLTSRHLVGYLGLHPTVRQSGNHPGRHGRVSKEGSAAARHVLVEAAWSAAKSPGPLRAFAERTAARRGRHVATVAVARKLAVLRVEPPYPRRGLRVRPPCPRRAQDPRARAGRGRSASQARRETGPGLEDRSSGRCRAPACRAGRNAYRRLVADWQAPEAEAGRGRDTGARIGWPSKRQAAPQT